MEHKTAISVETHNNIFYYVSFNMQFSLFRYCPKTILMI